jgi:hypothetical protein
VGVDEQDRPAAAVGGEREDPVPGADGVVAVAVHDEQASVGVGKDRGGDRARLRGSAVGEDRGTAGVPAAKVTVVVASE